MILFGVITGEPIIVHGFRGIRNRSGTGVDGLSLIKSHISSNLGPERLRESLLHTGTWGRWLYSDFPKKCAKKKICIFFCEIANSRKKEENLYQTRVFGWFVLD